jgi:hypothetical protein
MRALPALAVALALLALSSGCGGGDSGAHQEGGSTAAADTQPPATARAAPVARAPTARQRRMAALVRAWSARLNASDNAGVARLFALPAVIIQGPFAYRLATRSEIAEWHAGLPCAGKIVSIKFQGNYAIAVFRLANRGATPCDSPGSLAAARFEIVRGKIVSWEQVPVPKQQAPQGEAA